MLSALFDISGKTALVTGGARGVGLFIARGFVRAGVKVYVSSRSAETCDATAAELSKEGVCVSLPGDVSTVAGIEALTAELTKRESKLDILVNNAGATASAPLETYPEDAWDGVYDLNTKSPFFVTQQMLPLLRAAATAEDPARVINIGAVAGTRIYPGENYPYTVSKGAVNHLSRVLAMRLAGDHITVNTIAPGPVAAGMLARAADDLEFRKQLARGAPLGRVAFEDDVTGSANFLVSKAASYVTGQVIPLDGGATIGAPGF
jgi:NAD(P)-dependent dehydrogenase (short-subunit alcohol dehydrogenase family)